MPDLTPEQVERFKALVPRLSPEKRAEALSILTSNGVQYEAPAEPLPNEELPEGVGFAPRDTVAPKAAPSAKADAPDDQRFVTRSQQRTAAAKASGSLQDLVAQRRLQRQRERQMLTQRERPALTPEREMDRARQDPDLNVAERGAATILPMAATTLGAVGRGLTLGTSAIPARALPADGEQDDLPHSPSDMRQVPDTVDIDFELDSAGRRVPTTTPPVPVERAGRRGTGIQGQQVVDRMVDANPASVPIATAAAMMPGGLPGRIAGAATTAANIGKTGLSTAQRVTRMGGAAALGGGAVGAVDQGADAVRRAQEGNPEAAAASAAAIPRRALGDAGLALGFLPLAMAGQAAGSRYHDAIRESPQLGADLVQAEKAGMQTRVGIPGVTGPIRPTKAIRQAEVAQRRTGTEAIDITNRDTAKTALNVLRDEKGTVTDRVGTESGLYEASPEGADRFTADPAVEAVAEILRQGKSVWGTDTPGVDLKPARDQLRRLMRGRMVPAGDAPEGAPVITAEQARELGIDVDSSGMPAPVDQRNVGRSTDLDIEPGEALDLDVAAPPPRAQQSGPNAGVLGKMRAVERYGLVNLNDTDIPAAELERLAREGVIELRSGSGIGAKARRDLPRAPDGSALDTARILAQPKPAPAQAPPSAPLTNTYAAGKAPAEQVDEGVILLETLPLNAAELERAIGAFSVKAKEGRNVHTPDAESAAQFESIGNALRSMRQRFRPNKVTAKRGPDGKPVTKMDEDGNPIAGQYEPLEATLSSGERVTGYAAMKQGQHERLGEMQNQLKAFGLPENVEKIDPRDVGQLRAVMSKIAQGDEALERLAPKNPKLQAKIRKAAAHRAYNRILSGDVSAHGHVQGSGNPTANLSIGRSAKLRFDPAARAVGGVDLPSKRRAGISAERAARPAAAVDAGLVDAFLDAIGDGEEQEQ